MNWEDVIKELEETWESQTEDTDYEIGFAAGLRYSIAIIRKHLTPEPNKNEKV